MKRVGKFVSEFKKPEVRRGLAAGFAIIGLGSICLEGVDRGLPTLSGRAVTAPPVTPKMNERGVPQEPCSWTPYTHQYIKRLVGGGWSVKVDGRCRGSEDGEIRVYGAPYENDNNVYPSTDGVSLNIRNGQEVEVLCAKSGGVVTDKEGFQSDRWLYAEFPHNGVKVNAFLPAADAGFPPTFDPARRPTAGPVIPACPQI